MSDLAATGCGCGSGNGLSCGNGSCGALSLFFHAHAAVKETASLVTDYLAAVTAATTDVAETTSSGLLS